MTEGTAHAAGLPEDIARIFRLDGQRAVVTGAASGLGKAIALGYASFGAEVACLDIDLEALERRRRRSLMGRESTARGRRTGLGGAPPRRSCRGWGGWTSW